MSNSNSVYKGIALITTAVTKSPTESNPDRVTFSALPAGRRSKPSSNPQTNPSQPVFVHDIYDTTDGKTLAATSLTIPQVQHIMNSSSKNKQEADPSQESFQRQVLFTVHGYNGHPKGYLLWIQSILNRFQNFYVLPVIWPSMGKTLGYYQDKVYSKWAGEVLASIQVPTETLNKSLLIHSMGNRVLRHFAKSNRLNFDHIFMVAPDVDSRIFTTKYINGGSQEWRQDGLRIREMLSDKNGKIHVIYNRNDLMLLPSTILNLSQRLGRTGIDHGGLFCCKTSQDDLHQDIQGRIVAVDWSDSNPSDSHNYVFDWSVAAYIDSEYVV